MDRPATELRRRELMETDVKADAAEVNCAI